jgi:translin
MLSKKDMTTIQSELSSFDRVREDVLSLSREATRLSGSSIMEIHKGQLESAAGTIESVRSKLGKIDELSRNLPELSSAGGVLVAHQEYVEASTLLSYVRSGKIPSLKDAGTNSPSYLLGLLDVIGEFRRMTLNSLRKGDVAKAEALLDTMEGIYEDLQALNHTAIVPTFRVKMDASRRVIEATRGDVVTEVRRFSLEKALTVLEKRLGGRVKS